MSKPDLSTVEGIVAFIHRYVDAHVRYAPVPTETAAYLAEAVKFFEQHKDCECVKHTGNE